MSEAKVVRCDALVYGGTPAGIAFAIRAAREGLQVLIVTHTPHLGGMLTSGLCVWDTQHEGRRAPIYDELRAAMIEHYRVNYGEGSPQHRAAMPGPHGHSNGNFEPRVARQIIEDMVARETSVTVIRRNIPVSVRRDGRLLRAVTFGSIDGGGDHREVEAAVFADCSYEGDLMAVAGIAYRVGREPQSEFSEPHAGIIHMRPLTEQECSVQDRAARLKQGLRLRHFPGGHSSVPMPESGQGDSAVQAYNWRTVLTDDPVNQLPIPDPTTPVPASLHGLERLWFGDWLPNRKMRVNRPQLIGRQNAYVEGDWSVRRRVMDEHWEAFLAIMRSLQQDPSVPDAARWRTLGLAKDEFADNGHRPYEIYVRESRRLNGRSTFTEHDALLCPQYDRAPFHADAIAATEWYIDIHACSDRALPGALHEGKVILHRETFPGQVPFSAILPLDLDNVLVPVCLSSSHLGWGTIRLEPTWMNIAESAGLITAIAVRRGIPPAELDTMDYQPALARSGIMLGFFNELEPGEQNAAAQYFSTKGFFSSYDSHLAQPLSRGHAVIWAHAAVALLSGEPDPDELARRVHAARDDDCPISDAVFRRMLPSICPGAADSTAVTITRGEALGLLFAMTTKQRS